MLHDSTKGLIGDFVGSWQATTKSFYDRRRFEAIVKELLSQNDSWYEAIEYVDSLGKSGDYMWEWIGALNPPFENRLRVAIEVERNFKIRQPTQQEKSNE